MNIHIPSAAALQTVPTWVTFQLEAASFAVPAIGWIAFRKRAGGRWPAWVLAGFLTVWVVEAFVLSAKGSFLARPQQLVPNIPFAILLPTLLGYTLFTWIRPIREGVDAIPLHWIIGFQLYRALGFTFLFLFFQNMLPGAFALPAGIGDVVVGLAAPWVAQQVAQRKTSGRTLAIIWNWVGIIDLFVAVTCGFLSSPGPFQLLAHDAPNTLIGAFPLVLIPTIAVPFSLILHGIGLRRLRTADF
jgi:hypothetical protein